MTMQWNCKNYYIIAEQWKNYKIFIYISTHLYPGHVAGGLHPARHVDGVAPDVVLRLAAAHHARHHRAPRHAHPQREVLLMLFFIFILR